LQVRDIEDEPRPQNPDKHKEDAVPSYDNRPNRTLQPVPKLGAFKLVTVNHLQCHALAPAMSRYKWARPALRQVLDRPDKRRRASGMLARLFRLLCWHPA